MNIRPATLKDIPKMVGLLQELFLLEPDFPFVAPIHERGLGILLQASGCRGLVHVDPHSDALLGMLTLQPHISSGFGCKDAVLEDFIVTKSKRGLGIGSKLMEAARREALRMGYTRLRLAVDCENLQAKQFYDGKGWKPGRMTSYYFEIQQ